MIKEQKEKLTYLPIELKYANTVDKFGFSNLYHAGFNGDPKYFQIVLDNMEKSIEVSRPTNKTALSIIMRFDHCELLGPLLEKVPYKYLTIKNIKKEVICKTCRPKLKAAKAYARK